MTRSHRSPSVRRLLRVQTPRLGAGHARGVGTDAEPTRDFLLLRVLLLRVQNPRQGAGHARVVGTDAELTHDYLPSRVQNRRQGAGNARAADRLPDRGCRSTPARERLAQPEAMTCGVEDDGIPLAEIHVLRRLRDHAPDLLERDDDPVEGLPGRDVDVDHDRAWHRAG